jgi:hypothetical protein
MATRGFFPEVKLLALMIPRQYPFTLLANFGYTELKHELHQNNVKKKTLGANSENRLYYN